MQPEAAGKHLQGISDLTLAAPIRADLIEALDTRTYASRLRLLLRTLQALRTASREHATLRPFSDAVERVRTIHSFRLAILEPEQKLLLAVTFDRGWEPYVRIVWRELGALLDVIFCNCKGYVTACDHGFEAYAAWIRSAQVDTAFFYNALPLTVDDLHYLRQVERLHRDMADPVEADRQAVRLVVEDSEALARQAAAAHPSEAIQQGLSALSALYRLADMYPPGHPDDRYLLRAAHALLKELRGLLDRFPALRHGIPAPGAGPLDHVLAGLHQRFAAPLAWFDRQPPARVGIERPAPPANRDRSSQATQEQDDAAIRQQVQGGILDKYGAATHGCLVLIGVRDPAEAAGWLERLRNRHVTFEGDRLRPDLAEGDVCVNVAFTFEGLRRLGVPHDALGGFAREFREGMEARAGLLGDVHVNHPRNWSLPERNWPLPGQANARVQLSMVHVVVQLLTRCDQASDGDHEIVGNPRHPLHGWIVDLVPAGWGVQVLSVQPMRRDPANAPSNATAVEAEADLTGAWAGLSKDRFGFADGISQPVVDGTAQPAAASGQSAPRRWSDRIELGDLLLGHANSHGDLPAEVDAVRRNGSFLVVRKLSQDVDAFEHVVARESARLSQALQAVGASLSSDELKAKMMGRSVQGAALADDGQGADHNDFDYRADGMGARCPFQAHIRRANPRAPSRDGEPLPRIMRRGMSYGPPRRAGAQGGLPAGAAASPTPPAQGAFAQDEPAAAAPARVASAQAARPASGVLFMAYNASIAEQFEVIQRWISGGNSSGAYSGDPDPVLGIGEPGRPRVFRFEHAGQVLRACLDTPTRRPFVQLEWGAYLFVPARRALQEIEGFARAARAMRAGPEVASWSAERGERIIDRLIGVRYAAGADEDGNKHENEDAVQSWKAVLEDISARTSGQSADVWAAIRAHHDGVLRTPYGVLVASRALVDQVFCNPDGHYTVAGYQLRLRESIGEIYLGRDAGEQYEQQSAAANAAIQAITQQQAFDLAYRHTGAALQALTDAAQRAAAGLQPGPAADPPALVFEVKEITDRVLAALCTSWFGLPDPAGNVVAGGWDWARRDRPRCPGHFVSPSRCTFQPHPSKSVREYACAHGQALREAVGRLVQAHRKAKRAKLDSQAAQDPQDPQTAQDLRTAPDSQAGLDAPLSAAILDVYAHRDDDQADGEAASAILGVMMGFLPTVEGNLRASLYEWIEDRSFWTLQEAYLAPADPPQPGAPGTDRQADSPHGSGPASTAWDRACRALEKPLRYTLQLRPVPELVWRTAAAAHRLGEVDVLPQDRIVVSIVSAMHEALEAAPDQGDPDVYPVFGGDRAAVKPPLHACPGYRAAMGVLLGFIAALMEVGPLRPHPSPLTFSLDSRT